MSFLNGLNPPQAQAVQHTDGPLLIFAGAGSGKTRVLTYRVARMIHDGIDPYHILAITFTNKAAREMQERINAITDRGSQVWVSTFHAACTRILRRESATLGFAKGFTIFDTADTKRLLKDCLKEKNLNEMNYPIRYVAHVISTQKNELITPRQYESQVAGHFRETNIAEVYELYQKRLGEMNALDFDDIIFKTVELLENHPEILFKYQNRFRYVMVDEYQDTNHAQYRLVNLLAGYENNLCVVGDDDQSIYGWRGANIKNILQFEEDYPGATVVKLEENYRSTQTILEAANDVIANNAYRADKRLFTANEKGSPLRVYMANNERDEGAFVARQIQDHIRNDSGHYRDFAVLYRTNAQSRNIEDAFVKASIKYRIFGGVRFYEHMEVKDVLAYLKAINNPADDIAHMRIINVPKRGIGAASIEKVQQYAQAQGMSFGQAITQAAQVPGLGKKAAPVEAFAGLLLELSHFAGSNTVSATIKRVLQLTNYMDTLADGTPEGEERVSNVLELIATANAFEKESEDTSLGKFLEDVALVADMDNYQEGVDAVSLMTLHSAKGLEFKAVFLVGFEEHLFPTSRAIDAPTFTEMEEERRLCYVGFTRAKQLLYVTHATSRMRFDKVTRNAPSRFLGEVKMERLAPVNTMGKVREFVPSKAVQASQGITRPKMAMPTNKPLQVAVGDTVKIPMAPKYGHGQVLEIRPAGADYEVTIEFAQGVRKKFMANLARITKV